MSEKNNEMQAFPQALAITPLGREVQGYPGMTLRDYFAAKAMQGWLANFPRNCAADDSEWIAKKAYVLADAMLAAREES